MEPVFEDPVGDELEISNNRGTGNTATFTWGTHTVVYTATDTGNGKMAVCEFVITVTRELNNTVYNAAILNTAITKHLIVTEHDLRLPGFVLVLLQL